MSTSFSARARVLATHADGRVELALDEGPACPGCQCARVWVARTRTIIVELDRAIEIVPGSTIDLRITATDLLEASIWLHGLPWLTLLAGAVLGTLAGRGDLVTLIGAAGGFLAGLVLLRCHTQQRTTMQLAIVAN